jgi:hypothetical protein
MRQATRASSPLLHRDRVARRSWAAPPGATRPPTGGTSRANGASSFAANPGLCTASASDRGSAIGRHATTERAGQTAATEKNEVDPHLGGCGLPGAERSFLGGWKPPRVSAPAGVGRRRRVFGFD